MKQKRFETRMTLTVPTRGIITIEGSPTFVKTFFDNVRTDFVRELSASLAFDSGMTGKDFEVIETKTSPKETTLEVVEKRA